jgi:hypothetical protein
VEKEYGFQEIFGTIAFLINETPLYELNLGIIAVTFTVCLGAGLGGVIVEPIE